MHLKGKSAIVTGGSSGLGYSIVRKLADYGVNVLFVYGKNDEAAEKIEKEFESTDVTVKALKVDARKLAEAQRTVSEAEMLFGKIDILINNIGGSLAGERAIWEISEEVFDQVIEYNLKTNFNFTKAIAPHFMKNRAGTIVNVGSINGLRGREGQPAYSAAKGAVAAFTKTMARELGEYNVNVNMIASGMINNERSKKSVNEVYRHNLRNQCYIRNFVEPDDLAEMVAYLCCDEAKCITGTVMKMDSGEYI